MHSIPYSDNKNQALFVENNKTVPLVYFNIIKLNKGESYSCFNYLKTFDDVVVSSCDWND